jgi:hypothetical protein
MSEEERLSCRVECDVEKTELTNVSRNMFKKSVL